MSSLIVWFALNFGPVDEYRWDPKICTFFILFYLFKTWTLIFRGHLKNNPLNLFGSDLHRVQNKQKFASILLIPFGISQLFH